MRNLIRVLFLLLGFVGGPLWAAGINAGGVSSSIAQPGLGLVVEDKVKASTKKGSTQLVRDSARIGVGADEIRFFQFKQGVVVTRADFFKKYRESLGLGNDDAVHEGPDYSSVDGFTHTRWSQTYKGLPVLDASLNLWEKEGTVQQVSGRLAPHLDLDVTPTISESDALDAALNELSGNYPWENGEGEAPKSQLAVDVSGENSNGRLVYRFEIPTLDPEGFYEVRVDAKKGTIAALQELKFHAGINATYSGKTVFDGDVSFLGSVDEAGNVVLKSYRVDDPAQLAAKADVGVWDLRQSDAVLVSDSDKNGNFQDPDDAPGVSVKWALDKALEYYFVSFGWQGPDGFGARPVRGNLRIINPPNDSYFLMNGTSVLDFHAAGDQSHVATTVVGHEYTHAIADATAHLLNAGESGAVNEGLADFFGVVLYSFASGKPPQWTVGERDLKDPTPYPSMYRGAHYEDVVAPCNEANDFCYRHKNSTVLSHALYLVAMGGSGVNDKGQSYQVQGVGLQNAAKMAFLTLATKLFPSSTLVDARNGLVQVAESLFGKDSPEYKAVLNATYAVGLSSQPDTDQFIVPSAGEPEVSPWPAKFEHEVPAQAKACEIEISPFSDGKLTKKDLVPGSLMSMGGRTLCTAAKDLEANTVHVWKVHYEVPPQGIINKFTGIFSGLGGASRRAPAASPEASKEDWTWSEEHHFTTGGMEPNLISPGKAAGAEIRRKTKWSGLSYAPGGDEKPHPWPAKFLWKAPSAPHLEGFEIQVADQPPNSEDGDFSSTVYAHSLSVSNPAFQEDGNFKKEFVLKVDKTYYWRVRAKGPENKKGLWSEVRTFKTDMPKPSLLTKNGVLMAQPWAIPLEWSFEKEAQKYKLYLSKDSQLGEDEAVTLTTGNLGTFYHQAQKVNYAQYKTAVGKNEGNYYWAVAAQGPAPYFEWGAPSAVDTFKVDYSKTKPVLIYPKSPGASVPYGSMTVTFSWGSVELANQYKLAVYDRTPAGCGNAISESMVPGNSVSPNAPAQIVTNLSLPGLSGAANETLGKCWQVTAVGPNNILGEPSDKADYFIGPDAPVILSPANGADAADYEQLKVQWTSQWAPQGYKLCFQNVLSGVSAPCVMVASGTFEQQVKLAPGTTYQTILTAYGPNGTSTNSAGLHVFTTKQAPAEEKPKDDCSVLPLAPDVWNPAPSNTWDDAPVLAPLASFQWVPVANAASYEVQIVKFNPVDPTQNVYLPVIQVSEPQLVDFSHMPYAPWGFWMVKVQAKDKCGNVSPTTVRQYKVLFN